MRDPIEAHVRSMLTHGDSLESVLQFLRESGFSKGRTMQFLSDQLGMDSDEVPEIVHRSRTWADRLAIDTAFSSAMLAALDSLRTGTTDEPVDLTEFLREDDSANDGSES